MFCSCDTASQHAKLTGKSRAIATKRRKSLPKSGHTWQTRDSLSRVCRVDEQAGRFSTSLDLRERFANERCAAVDVFN
jgi:hypothetical protein